MLFFRKILTKIYCTFLKYCTDITLNKNVKIDYRVEIDNKENIIIGQNSVLYKNITIYKHQNSFFSIGSNSHIAPYGYFLLGNKDLTIGNDVAISPFCAFYCVSNYRSKNKLFKDTYIEDNIKIGNNVFIGSHSIVLPGTVIEDNVVIASNSVVRGRLKKNKLYAGSPAIEKKVEI